MRIAQRAGRDGEFVNAVGEEFRGDAKMLAVGLNRKIVDGRRDPQRLPRAKDVERLRRRGEGEADPPLARRRIGRRRFAFAFFAVAGRRRIVIGGAAQHAREPVIAPAAPAGCLGNGEWRRGGETQLIGLVVETGLVGKLQSQDRDAPVRNRLVKAQHIGLLLTMILSLQRAYVVSGGAERLCALRRDAGRGPQLHGEQPRERANVDRLRESQRDLRQLKRRIAAFFRVCGVRRRQKRNKLCFERAGFHVHPRERLPGVGGTKLQRARPEPAPFARRLRGQRYIFRRRVFRAARFRARVGREEDGERIVAAQESVWRNARAIGALRAVEDRRRFGAQRRRERNRRANAEKQNLYHRADSLAHRVLLFFMPDFSKSSATASSGGAAGGGDRPTIAARIVVAGASGGTRASRK